MPDIPNRDELERKLSRALGKLQQRQLAALLEYMGDPPDINKVPQEFWNEVGEELARAVVPFSEGVFLEAAERMLGTVTVGVDWSMVNQAAANYAREHAYNLSYAMVQTRQRELANLVPRFFEEGWTQGELTQRLSRYYNPISSEMIARTEVTRAAVEGERATLRELEKEGITMVEVWQTRFDELVCPICEPRNDKKKGDGWTEADGPPAHPRCRCWVTHEIDTEKL